MKKNILCLLVAMTAATGTSLGQEVMKVELKDGRVVSYPVEEVNRFYFEKTEQQEVLADDCEISIEDEVIMCDAVAFDLGYDTGISRVYAAFAETSQLEQYSDAQLVKMIKGGGITTPVTNSVIYFGGMEEGTDYTILYFGENAQGIRGNIYQHHVTTKVAADEPTAEIKNLAYDNRNFYFTIEIDDDVMLDYYLMVDVGKDLEPIEGNLALIGMVWKQAIANTPDRGHYYTGDDFSETRTSNDNSIRIITWVRDFNREFSGIISGKLANINDGARERAPMQQTKQKQMGAANKKTLAEGFRLHHVVARP